MKPAKAWLTLFLLAMTGCGTLAPKYVAPVPPVPGTWPGGGAAGQTSGAPAIDLSWRDFYSDEQIRKVLDLALQHNRDLRIAALNVEKAMGYYRIQRAALVPTLNAAGTMSRQRVPTNVSGLTTPTYEEDGVTVGMSAWELDFFGRVKSLKNQALEQYLATQQARESAQVTLLAEVANAYLALAADREMLGLAQDTLASQERSHDLVRRRFEVGVASDIDVQRARQSMETARGDLAKYTSVTASDKNALDLLVGTSVPETMLPKVLGLVTVMKDISPGLPSQVLIRRPDILMAENQLKAANANIGAARAAFFPKISLTSNIGTLSPQLSGLFKSGQNSWTFSPQISLPIFDMGTRRANLAVAKADRDIYVAQYEKAIQVAFKEVADTLVARASLDDQLTAQAALTQALETTYQLAQARYKAGIDGFLGVLDAQRSLYSAQQGLIVLRQAKFANLVTLYKVLGGGHGAGSPGTPGTSGPGKG